MPNLEYLYFVVYQLVDGNLLLAAQFVVLACYEMCNSYCLNLFREKVIIFCISSYALFGIIFDVCLCLTLLKYL